MDLSELSNDDLVALKSGDLTKVSTAGLRSLRGQSAPPAAAPAKPDLTQGAGLTGALQTMHDQDPSAGGAEMLLKNVTGTLARIPAGIAGLATTAGNALGVTNKDPADVVENTQNALTYQPQTASGQAGQEGLHQAVAPVANAVDHGLGVAGRAIGGATGENVARTVVPAVVDAATTAGPLASVEGGLRAAAMEGTASAPTTVEGAVKPSDSAPLATARGAGYKARPSDITAANPGDASVQPGLIAKVGEKLGGSGAQKARYTADNQALTTQLTGQDIGLGDNVTKLTPDQYAKAKLAPAAKYDAVGQDLGTFKGSDQLRSTLADIEADPTSTPTARSEARRIGAMIDSQGDFQGPQVMKLIAKLRDTSGGRPVANALESEVDRQLSADPDSASTLQDFRDARQMFSKIYLAQDATKKGGQVDAQVIGRVHAKNPNLLTGNMRVIGTAANELPGVTGVPKAGSGGGPGIVQTVLGAPARAIMGSDAVQNATTGARPMTATEGSYVPDFGRRPTPPGAAIIGPARQLTNDSGPIPMGQDAFQGDRGVPGHPGEARPGSLPALPAPGGTVIALPDGDIPQGVNLGDTVAGREVQAATQHPGAARPSRHNAILALPAPGQIPAIVDSDGRVAAVPQDMDRYLTALGIQRPSPIGLPDVMGGASDSTQSVGKTVQNRAAGDKAAASRRAASKATNTSSRRGED